LNCPYGLDARSGRRQSQQGLPASSQTPSQATAIESPKGVNVPFTVMDLSRKEVATTEGGLPIHDGGGCHNLV
jgi:hypothetical protein